ncbi:ATP synthase protein I [Arthrobacter sp. B3I9]|nr:ATP synthase protein I [Arthrobacter sp. B3I9]
MRLIAARLPPAFRLASSNLATIGISMTSNADSGRPSGNGPVGVSGPTKSLWLRLLALSSAASGGGLLLTGVIALLVQGMPSALSALFGGALVMAFFAISLAVGHFVGRTNPSGAIGIFVATYFIKVVGFAVVLFAIGAPAWLNGRWFLGGAVVAVVLWQAAEIYGFSKARLQIYNDPDTTEGGTNV